VESNDVKAQLIDEWLTGLEKSVMFHKELMKT